MFFKGTVGVLAVRVVILETETKSEDDGGEDQPKLAVVNVLATKPDDDARSGDSREDKKGKHHEFEDV